MPATAAHLSPNVGHTDRALRIVASLVLAAVAAFALDGGWAVTTWTLSLVLLVTGLVRFCPLYRLFRVDTCPTR